MAEETAPTKNVKDLVWVEKALKKTTVTEEEWLDQQAEVQIFRTLSQKGLVQ